MKHVFLGPPRDQIGSRDSRPSICASHKACWWPLEGEAPRRALSQPLPPPHLDLHALLVRQEHHQRGAALVTAAAAPPSLGRLHPPLPEAAAQGRRRGWQSAEAQAIQVGSLQPGGKDDLRAGLNGAAPHLLSLKRPKRLKKRQSAWHSRAQNHPAKLSIP